MKRRLCIIALLALSVVLYAQEAKPETSEPENKFEVTANFLTRGEVRSGGIVSTDEEIDTEDFASFLLERTLLGLSYERPGIKCLVNAQHSGVWGSAEGSYFNVYEAWVKLHSKIGIYALVGRQSLSYDDQRIFGNDDWAMTSRSHDAIKLAYEGKGHKLHLIGAFNQTMANLQGGTFFSGGVQPYKALESLWYHYDVPETAMGFSLLFMNVGMQGEGKGERQKTYQQQLFGTYLSYKPRKWSAEASFYNQSGKEEHGIPIQAWMTSLKAAYNPGKWSLYGGYDYLSGDKNFATPPKGMLGVTRHETIRGFSSLYGSHHKFYGAMDFFYVTTYYSGFTPGLQNLYLGGRWMPAGKYALDVSAHYFATATKLKNADRPLGYELEFSASWQIFKDASLSLGYSYMRGTETMEVLKRTSGNRQLRWGWIMLIVNPRFFTGRW